MIYKKLKQYVPEKFSLVWLGIFLAFVASAFSVTAYYFLYGFLETIIVEKNIEKAIPVSSHISGSGRSAPPIARHSRGAASGQ